MNITSLYAPVMVDQRCLLANHVVLDEGVRIGDDCVIEAAVAPICGPRADGAGAEQSEPTPEIYGLLRARLAIDGVAAMHSVAAVLEARPGSDHRELALDSGPAEQGERRPTTSITPARQDSATRCRTHARRGDPAPANPDDR